MTELKNYLKPLIDKNAQLVTCGIFYCRDSDEINGCGSLQTSSWLDSNLLRNRQQNIPLSVRQHNKRQENRSINFKLKSNEENFNGNCDCYNCI
jgi:hypothetical protein